MSKEKSTKSELYDLEKMVKDITTKVKEKGGSIVIMAGVPDTVGEAEGTSACAAVVGNKGDLLRMLAEVAARPDSIDLVSVVGKGFLMGTMVRHLRNEKSEKEPTAAPAE
jgi:hypothetical protein